MSRRVISIKKRRATPYIKKRTCTTAIFHKNFKNSKKIVVKICRQTLKFDKKEKVR